jgi:hypothetical protein
MPTTTSEYREASTTTSSSSTDVVSSVILFMDLRNDIVVLNKRHQVSKQSNVTSTLAELQGDHMVYSESNPPAAVSNEIDMTVEMHIAHGTIRRSGYGFFIDVDSTNAWLPEITKSWGNVLREVMAFEKPMSAPAFLSSQPMGSWAVDADGNVFVSALYAKDQPGPIEGEIYNDLTGNDPSVIAKIAIPAVFYPVAPL